MSSRLPNQLVAVGALPLRLPFTRKERQKMSPQTSAVLMEQIVPRLKTIVPYIKTVGSEDHAELLQDGICMAAKMLHNLELRGKQVTAGNVTYYIALHLKSGRRSYGCGRTDAMFSSTQLDGKATVLSMETEVGWDPEMNEPIRLGEFLSCSQDDPSMTAGRNLDWEMFLASHDYRYGIILKDMVHDKTALEEAKDMGVHYHKARELRFKMADELAEFMGPDAVADSVKIPLWRAGVHAERERSACRQH